jgi:hypothetical protein
MNEFTRRERRLVTMNFLAQPLSVRLCFAS